MPHSNKLLGHSEGHHEICFLRSWMFDESWNDFPEAGPKQI